MSLMYRLNLGIISEIDTVFKNPVLEKLMTRDERLQLQQYRRMCIEQNRCFQ